MQRTLTAPANVPIVAGCPPRAALDLVPEAICVVRADGEYVYANTAAEELITAQHPGADCRRFGELRWEAVDALHRPVAEEDVPAARTRRTGRDVRDEVLGLRLPDGERLWVRVSTRAVCTEGPPPYDVIVSFTDVTAEREAATRLDEANTLFRTAFDGAPIGMALVSTTGKLLKVNLALCALLGRRRDELVRARFQDLTHPDDLAADEELLDRCLRGEISSYQLDKRYLHASGREIWASLWVSLVRTPDGEPAHFVSQVQDVTQERELERRLRDLAERDPLTGLPNRRSFDDALEHAVDHGRRGAIVMLDLDHFKALNDQAGHVEGDRFLVEAGHAIERRLRGSDVVARLGGDEFAVLLDATGGPAARQVAAELVDAVRAVSADGWPVRVTASAGVATIGHGETTREVMLRADRALYAAKGAGRDGTVVAA